jgi:UDP-glucose 4-epimerase
LKHSPTESIDAPHLPKIMSILVTGGAGYVGSHAVHDLVDAGESVVVLDNLSTGFASALPKSVRLVIGDVGDQMLVSALIGEHKNFAGSTIVPESIVDPLRYYGNNTANSRALIEAAVKGGVKHFIFSSTAAVYGNPARVPVAEDDPTIPVSPYGWSKLMIEQMLRDASSAHSLTHVALRYFNVAGADPDLRTGLQTPGATHLIKVAVEAALGRRARIDVYGTDYDTPDGTCIRDFIHVSDLARAHRAALTYLRAGNTSATLNCGYGRGYSVREVIDAVRRAAGHDFPVAFGGRRPGDIAVSVAATDRIRKVLHWRAEFEDLGTIVKHALAWERHLTDSRESRQH